MQATTAPVSHWMELGPMLSESMANTCLQYWRVFPMQNGTGGTGSLLTIIWAVYSSRKGTLEPVVRFPFGPLSDRGIKLFLGTGERLRWESRPPLRPCLLRLEEPPYPLPYSEAHQQYPQSIILLCCQEPRNHKYPTFSFTRGEGRLLSPRRVKKVCNLSQAHSK